MNGKVGLGGEEGSRKREGRARAHTHTQICRRAGGQSNMVLSKLSDCASSSLPTTKSFVIALYPCPPAPRPFPTLPLPPFQTNLSREPRGATTFLVFRPWTTTHTRTFTHTQTHTHTHTHTIFQEEVLSRLANHDLAIPWTEVSRERGGGGGGREGVCVCGCVCVCVCV